MISIGIDLGGTNIKGALVDSEKGLLDKKSLPTEAGKGKEHVFDRIRMTVDLLLKRYNGTDRPAGIGIGSPGMVSLDRTIVRNSPNLPGWESVNLADEIKIRTGLPCIIENDANLAALGSSRFGAGKDFDSLIFITLGTGVGSGIIYNRNLFRGMTGAAGELGHVIIDYQGRYSNSNTRGGIEAYLGSRFLCNIAMETIRQRPDDPLYEQFHTNKEELQPVDLYTAAEGGNRTAAGILSDAGEKLGCAIVSYIHILDIRKIVVGGGIAKAGRWLLEPARDTVLENLMPPYHDGLEILYEPLGNDAALYGASSLALEHL